MDSSMMNTARVIEVIETTLTRRGDGKETPIRIITQYWSKDGQLLAERDPSPEEKRKDGKLMDESALSFGEQTTFSCNKRKRCYSFPC